MRRSLTITKEEPMAEDTVMPPVHPGEILQEEFLAPLGVSQYQLAKAAATTWWPQPAIKTPLTALPTAPDVGTKSGSANQAGNRQPGNNRRWAGRAWRE